MKIKNFDNPNFKNLCPNCFKPIFGKFPCPYCNYNKDIADSGHIILDSEPTLTDDNAEISATQQNIKNRQVLPVGTILNSHYAIGQLLGQGGFGITYLAYDLTLNRRLAIKEFFPISTVFRKGINVEVLPGKNSEFKNSQARFNREAEILARFNSSPGIVHITDLFSENGTTYFVMEYIEGMSFRNYLSEHDGKISYEDALRILTPVMNVMEDVHQSGLIHRDIAPDNIYITAKGEIILLDFGAFYVNNSQDEENRKAVLKKGYAPVEQYDLNGKQGPWTDVYAMGAVFYRSITGIVPQESSLRLSNDHLERPSSLGIKLPSAAEEAIMKALSVKIDDRFQSMALFSKALQKGKKRFSLSALMKKKKLLLSFTLFFAFVLMLFILQKPISEFRKSRESDGLPLTASEVSPSVSQADIQKSVEPPKPQERPSATVTSTGSPTPSAVPDDIYKIYVGNYEKYSSLVNALNSIPENAGKVIIYIKNNLIEASDNDDQIEIPPLKGIKSVSIEAQDQNKPVRIETNADQLFFLTNGIKLEIGRQVAMTNFQIIGGSMAYTDEKVTVPSSELWMYGNLEDSSIIGGGLAYGSGSYSEVGSALIYIYGNSGSIFSGGEGIEGGDAAVTGSSKVIIASDATVGSISGGGNSFSPDSKTEVNESFINLMGSAKAITCGGVAYGKNSVASVDQSQVQISGVCNYILGGGYAQKKGFSQVTSLSKITVQPKGKILIKAFAGGRAEGEDSRTETNRSEWEIQGFIAQNNGEVIEGGIELDNGICTLNEPPVISYLNAIK